MISYLSVLLSLRLKVPCRTSACPHLCVPVPLPSLTSAFLHHCPPSPLRFCTSAFLHLPAPSPLLLHLLAPSPLPLSFATSQEPQHTQSQPVTDHNTRRMHAGSIALPCGGTGKCR